MLSLSQLVTPVTEDEALDTLLTALSQLGFQATSWQSGSIQLILLRVFARTISRLTDQIALIAAGGFTSLAATTSGASGFMTLLARYFYDIERNEAQQTIGKILLTSSATAGTNTWGVGDLIISDSPNGTEGANTYTNTEAGTLGPGASISIEFKADVAGPDANLAPDTTWYVWTGPSGITPTNPALLPDSNTWITTPGADEESDARLLLRCLGRWDRLTYGNTDGAYRAWALEALPALTRVTIERAAGDGSVGIIGATSLGGLTVDQCTTIADYINGTTDGVGRRPQNDIVTVSSATAVTTPALEFTIYALSSVQDTIADDAEAAITDYLGELPIGGLVLQGNQGRVLYSALIALVKDLTGVKDVKFTSISDDVLLNTDEIYTPTITITVIPVAPGVR